MAQIHSSGPEFTFSKGCREGTDAEDYDHEHGEARTVDPARPPRHAVGQGTEGELEEGAPHNAGPKVHRESP
jgi:hypothetical protein